MHLLADLRQGVRMLVKHPGLTATAVIALGLGIGLTATMWSIIWGALLRGLPFEESDRILDIHRTRPSHNIEHSDVPPADFAAWREQQRSFEDLAAFGEGTMNVSSSAGPPERFEGGWVTPATFALLRVQPLLGRAFTEEDARSGAAPVAILGWGIWQGRFGGDPEIIGKTIRVNGVTQEIIGVMPKGYLFPTTSALWLPRTIDPLAQPWGQGEHAQVMGRLRPGVSIDEARREFETIAARLAADHPKENEGMLPVLQPFVHRYVDEEPQLMLWTMMAAVFGVFLIACSNVANLQLARAAVRTREVAIRTALGAGRWRIVSQHLSESLVLALAGALLGTGIAWLGTELFMDAIRDTEPPFWIDVRLDGAVLAFTLGITFLAALVSGIIPAVQATRGSLHDVLKDESRGSSSLRMGRFSRALVIVELALSGGLLVAAGFMIQSVVQLSHFDYGVKTEGVFTARIGLFEASYPDTLSRQRFWGELDRRLAELPNHRGTSVMTALPGLGGWRQAFALEGKTYPEARDYPETRRIAVTPGWFQTFGVKAVDGRVLEPGDLADAMPVAVVSQGFATRHFGEASPLGRRIRIGGAEATEPWLTIVGVVPDVWYEGTSNEPLHTSVFTPVAQGDYRFLTLAVAADGDPYAFQRQVEAIVSGLDPDQPIYWARTLDEAIYRNGWFYGVFGTLFMVFGAAALFLATVGVYGVVSFAVAQRTREVGVRMALGASAGDVLGMFMRQGGRQLLVGLSGGLALAFFLAKGLTLVMFQVNTANPLMYASVSAVLAGTCLVATFLPARRAMGVDPIVALRYE